MHCLGLALFSNMPIWEYALLRHGHNSDLDSEWLPAGALASQHVEESRAFILLKGGHMGDSKTSHFKFLLDYSSGDTKIYSHVHARGHRFIFRRPIDRNFLVKLDPLPAELPQGPKPLHDEGDLVWVEFCDAFHGDPVHGMWASDGDTLTSLASQLRAYLSANSLITTASELKFTNFSDINGRTMLRSVMKGKRRRRMVRGQLGCCWELLLSLLICVFVFHATDCLQPVHLTAIIT